VALARSAAARAFTAFTAFTDYIEIFATGFFNHL
jgi:hypothetical protein